MTTLEIEYIVTMYSHSYIVDVHYGGLSLDFINSQLRLRLFKLGCEAYDYETKHAINIRSFVESFSGDFALYLTDDAFIVSDNKNKMK